jgi:carboxyl-terminal processing protease
MPSGMVVQIQTKSATSNKSVSGNVLTNKPLTVIVNGNTAAAAEVLAAALKDSSRATLIGTTTLGKGSVQVVRELSFGGAVRYTAAYYLSPLGHGISNEGVSPDIYVNETSDDQQLSIALETALSLS